MCAGAAAPPAPPAPPHEHAEHGHEHSHEHGAGTAVHHRHPDHQHPADELRARLDDPATVAALHELIDHAELLALTVGMLDGLLRRSETLTGNLADSLSELRTGAVAGSAGLRSTVGDLGAMLPAVVAALPTLQLLLASPIVAPPTVHAVERLGTALVDGLAQAPAPGSKNSVRSLLADLRDPDTARGLRSLLSVARSLGRQTTV